MENTLRYGKQLLTELQTLQDNSGNKEDFTRNQRKASRLLKEMKKEEIKKWIDLF